ncbi:MAG: urea transporter [Myxococcales bacterium]|nr:urea transporter [Myxococcales bacterium]
MALSGALAPPVGGLRGRVEFVVDAVLRAYAQILFSSSRAVGLVLLLGTALAPRALAYGLAAVLLALATARLFRLSPELIRSGLLGYSSMLVGLGAAVLFEPTIDAHAITVIGVATAVVMTSALHAAMGTYFNLPPLTIPFLLVFYLVLGAARVLDIPLEHLSLARIPAPAWMPSWLVVYLESLGALFFLPRVDVGAVVLGALLLHSRIAWVFSLVGAALAILVAGRAVLILDGTLPFVLGYNFVLTAIAVGGVWFVPSRASLLLAIGATLVCGMVAIGLAPLMTVGALPLLILPFNLTIILLLYAMRLRIGDAKPPAVDSPGGTPEEHLVRHRARFARFGAHLPVRVHAPFLGRWRCTQGWDGEHTHREAWRHAWDFEVADAEGRTFRGDGRSLGDYYCYRLPVVAAADGSVVEVVDHHPDNPIGEPDLRNNWGNYVLLYHAPAVYSLVCHLAPGSAAVRPGQLVRRGDRLGLCGASGRSPVPHLHFQLQASPHVGAPTIAGELHDVVVEPAAPAGEAAPARRWESALVPRRGDVVRNLEPARAFARFLSLTPGEELRLRRADDQTIETIAVDVDLLGDLILRSRERGARAHFERSAEMLVFYETEGRRSSLLWPLHVALARIPFELSDELRWSDRLDRRGFLPWPRRLLHDLLAPLRGDGLMQVDYRLRRVGRELTICATSAARERGGRALVESTLVLHEDVGIERLEVRAFGRTIQAERVRDEAAAPPPPALDEANAAEEVRP